MPAILPNGITRVPFQICLPAFPPPSVDLGIPYASITYRITALLTGKKLFSADYQVEKRFYVRTPLRAELLSNSAPQSGNRVWQTADGRIEMEALIPRSHFALHTDAVEISYTFRNASKLTVTNVRVDFEVREK
jgi:hypothetical protein